jgi:hypothetical protein
MINFQKKKFKFTKITIYYQNMQTVFLNDGNEVSYDTPMLYRVHLTRVGFELTRLVVIGTDCIGSCNSNYHTIMTTMAPSSC